MQPVGRRILTMLGSAALLPLLHSCGQGNIKASAELNYNTDPRLPALERQSQGLPIDQYSAQTLLSEQEPLKTTYGNGYKIKGQLFRPSYDPSSPGI
jgi:hypothetical protein